MQISANSIRIYIGFLVVFSIFGFVDNSIISSSLDESQQDYQLSFHQSNKLTYIHDEDTITANSFKTQLETWNWIVDLVLVRDLAARDWVNYDLIIIGGDTGFNDKWDDSSQVSFIDNLSVPILITGYGAPSFYSELGLTHDWGSSAIGSATSVMAEDLAHPVFNSPNAVADEATIFTSSQSEVAFYVPYNDGTVEIIGRDPSYTNYAPITVQLERYGFWGYAGSPDDWTQDGANLFENLIVYLTGYQPSQSVETSTPPSTTSTTSNESPLNIARIGIMLGMMVVVSIQIRRRKIRVHRK